MSIVAIHIEATRAAPVTDPSTVQPANLGETKKGFSAIPRARHGWMLTLHSGSRGRRRTSIWMVVVDCGIVVGLRCLLRKADPRVVRFTAFQG